MRPTLTSTQAPVTAPTTTYAGPMANPDVARTSPGTPQPGPAVDPSPGPTWTFTPTASPNQTLDTANRAAVTTPPGYAGPVALTPGSPMQDFAGVGQTRIDVPAVPDDASQG